VTILEYDCQIQALSKLSPEEKVFLKNICTAVGHEIFKDPRLMADVCVRCGDMTSWLEQPSSLKKISDAMSVVKNIFHIE